MATEEWLSAARNYNSMSERARAEYWQQLTQEQQSALRDALAALAPSQPSLQARQGCGCFRFIFRGCLVFLLLVVILTIWSRFPSFYKPETSRFDLWPESTSKASSVLEPKDRRRLDAYSEAHYFFPIKELPRWFAAAQLRPGDVAVMTLLKTVQSEDVSLKGETIDFSSVSSSVLIMELTRSAPEILRGIPRSMAVPENIEGVEVLGFPSPPGGPNQERWYWAAPNPRNLVIGGRAAVEQVLAIAAGRQSGISGRRVLRPILRDLEHARLIELDLVPPAREASMGIFKQIGDVVQSIPGLSMLFSLRGQAVGVETLSDGGCLQKLDYQFSDRIPATAIWAFFKIASKSPQSWASSGKSGEVPEEVQVRHGAGLVAVGMRYDSARCKSAEGAGERVKLFIQ